MGTQHKHNGVSIRVITYPDNSKQKCYIINNSLCQKKKPNISTHSSEIGLIPQISMTPKENSKIQERPLTTLAKKIQTTNSCSFTKAKA